jgi:hypothetical protein
VVFVLPQDVDAEAATAALRTIQAHTADVEAEFIIERPETTARSNRAQIRQAMALAEQHEARGVFWLDLSVDDDILLYLHEPKGLDTLMRRIPRAPESDAATFESLGVVVSSISTALVAGGEIGMTVVELEEEVQPEEVTPPPEEPPPVVVKREKTPGRGWPLVRVGVGYVGNSFGDQLTWQNGVRLAIDFRPLRRMFLGVAGEYVFPSHVRHELVEIDIRRYPVDLHGGFRGEPLETLALEAEAAATVEVLNRRSSRLLVEATPARDFVVFSAGPRGRLIWNPVAGLELFVMAGLDVVINNVDYVVQDDVEGQRIEVLDAHQVRARVGGGMSYAFF